MTTSSAVIMPRSPWLASLGWMKKEGVPVDERVERNLAADVARLAHAGSRNAAPGVPDQLEGDDEVLPEEPRIADASAVTPPASASNVRSAEFIRGCPRPVSCLLES